VNKFVPMVTDFTIYFKRCRQAVEHLRLKAFILRLFGCRQHGCWRCVHSLNSSTLMRWTLMKKASQRHWWTAMLLPMYRNLERHSNNRPPHLVPSAVQSGTALSTQFVSYGNAFEWHTQAYVVLFCLIFYIWPGTVSEHLCSISALSVSDSDFPAFRPGSGESWRCSGWPYPWSWHSLPFTLMFRMEDGRTYGPDTSIYRTALDGGWPYPWSWHSLLFTLMFRMEDGCTHGPDTPFHLP